MTKPPPKLPATIPALAIAALLAPPSAALAQSLAEVAVADSAPEAEPFDERLFGGLRYRYVGPSRGGRVTAVAGHTSHPSTFYMGATGGGVWKTDNYGHSWRNLSDGYFGTGSIGAIRVAQSNPEVVYVSTGSDGLRSNVIVGDGVYRSDDAGATWRHIGLERTGNSGALLIHPTDPELVYVAAIGNPFAPTPERGVYRSRDGGERWELVLFVSDSTGAVDLEFAPDDPSTIYASMWRAERKPWTIISGSLEDGIFVSRDGGDSWERATEGLPTGLRGKSDLAVTPADPDRVYALFEAPADTGGVYRSDDRGRTWHQVTDFQPIRNRPFYYTNLEAHPTDPDMLWGMAEGHWLSEDGGETWTVQPTPHERWEPGGPVGAWESHGGCETGPVVPKPGDPEIVYASCKGRFGVFNGRTGQEQQYYVGFWNLYGHNPRDLEFRFQRTVPVHVSPHDPERVYHGSQYVHVTTDGGRSWERISPDLTAFTPETQVVSGAPITLDVTGEEHFATLYDIQESVLEPGVIWAGANDGPVHLTRDGGATWTDVTPPGIGPHGRVQSIEVSRHDPAKAYVAILRYQLGDFAPYAFRTEDYGATWTLITTGSNGVPEGHPARVVREDPVREGLLYMGSEFGIFVSFDDGESWQSFQLNLPVTPVTDIKVVRGDLALSTMGRGFWILDNVTPLRELNRVVADAQAHLFQARDAYRLRYGGGGYGERQAHQPEYPPVGAQIDYTLPADADGPVTLEILDAAGALVRSLSSEEPGEYGTPAEPGMREWRTERVGAPRLEAGAGTHRFTWELTLPGPWDPDPERSGRGGPMVPPGTYTARLSVGSWSASRAFEVLLDPRVAAEGVRADDIAAQVALAVRVRDALSEARLAADRIGEARERAGGDVSAEVRAVERQLVTEARRYSRTMLIDQLRYLYRNLIRADQPPGEDAVRRYGQLREALDEHLRTLEELLPPETPSG